MQGHGATWLEESACPRRRRHRSPAAGVFQHKTGASVLQTHRAKRKLAAKRHYLSLQPERLIVPAAALVEALVPAGTGWPDLDTQAKSFANARAAQPSFPRLR